MSTYETSAIHELTDSKLDAVAGGCRSDRDFIVCGEQGCAGSSSKYRSTGESAGALILLQVWD
jgi:hypothetical protein